MPTYSYRCRDCDVAFDIQQTFQEDSLTECPQCDGNLRKLFNTVGVVFKGSGFYRTDSRATGQSDSGSSSGSSGSGGSNGTGAPSSGSGSSSGSASDSAGSSSTSTSSTSSSGTSTTASS